MLESKENRVKIEGVLSEIALDYTTFKKNGSDVKAIGGVIKVRVTQPINGVDTELEVPVHMFASELTNKGTSNPAYESIERIKKEYVSIAASDYDTADRIRITSGQITMNEYYNQNDALVSFPRIQASFVSKIKKEECKPEATFSAIFAIGSKGYHTDAEGVEDTSRYEIRAALPQYGGKVDVVTFVGLNPKVIEHIANDWDTGDTVRANGRLNFSSHTETTVKEVDFGEPIETTRTVSVSELIITGGSSTPLEGDFAFDPDEIAAAVKERQVRLDELRERAKNTNRTSGNSSKKDSFKDLGF